MQPQIILYWPAIIVATIAAFCWGGLWYGPLFGKAWGKAMGMDMNQKPDPKVMRRAFALQACGLFLTSYVMTHTGQIWRPSVWGAGIDMSDSAYGFFNAFFVWLGFYIPQQFSKVGWEGRSWKVFFINAGHDLTNLMIISQILAHWRLTT